LSHDFAELVQTALSLPKVIQDSTDWREGRHPEYSECDLPVFVPGMPSLRVRLHMTAHMRKEPRKCGFTLILGRRIFSLDVNPARIHNNKTLAEKVACSHWTTWPCEVAEPDARDLYHQQWFGEFLRRANTSFFGRYDRPPYLVEQLDLI
jgi:hypothetical protein